MTFTEQVDKIKDAFEVHSVVATDLAVNVRRGHIYAGNRKTCALIKCDEVADVEFTTTSVDLLDVARRFGKPSFTVDDCSITVKEGRRRTKLPFLVEQRTEFEIPEGFFSFSVPDDFISSLKNAARFTKPDQTRQWLGAIRVEPSRLLSTSAIIAHAEELKDALCDEILSIPHELWRLLSARASDELCEFGYTDSFIGFSYTDGTWVICSRGVEVPDQLANVIDQGFKEPHFEIEKGWRTDVLDFLGVADETVEVKPTGMYAKRYSSEHDLLIDCGTEIEGAFAKDALETVLKDATSINFDQYPSPVSFTTPYGKGVIAGKV